MLELYSKITSYSLTVLFYVDISTYMHGLCHDAEQASRLIAAASTHQKNTALLTIADELNSNRDSIIKANAIDMQLGETNNLEVALLDRLELTSDRIDAMIEGVEQIATLPDPIGEISAMTKRPSGIEVGKMRVPLGVIGIIYESRPNVTVDAASLCLKSGNAAILRGGSEAFHSNQAIAAQIAIGLEKAGLPRSVVQVLDTQDRDAVGELIRLKQFVDVIIPRGGKGLIERISNQATVPVIKHLDGNCHVYIDGDADIEKAIAIAINAKTHRYGVCNAMETLLVAQSLANDVLPRIVNTYLEKGLEIRACEQVKELLGNEDIKAASDDDWFEEYLAPIVAIKIVADVNEAITHINHYSSAHSEAIVSENISNVRTFVQAVDSSSVLVNASTRFADGFEYGLGAEIGISTDKIHARGPVGLEGLTSQKWVVYGNGSIRQ